MVQTPGRSSTMVFALVRLIMAAFAIAAFATPAAMAEVNTAAARHAAEDAVGVQTPAQQRSLNRHTLAVSAKHAKAAAATVVDNPHDVGQWGPVVPWPIVAIHAALLPNGKVLAYASIGDNATESYPVQDHTQATVWNPATGAQTPVDESGFNLFCSGLAHLFDGRLFIAGGNKDHNLDGINQTHLFDPATNTWSVGPQMAAGRWYPT